MINCLKEKKDWSKEFQKKEPFDHVILDNFLEESFAKELKNNFPDPLAQKWWSYDNPLEKKLAFNDLTKLDIAFTKFFKEINSDHFVNWLSDLSGLKLHADDALLGGGLHLIKRDGKLDVHEDFNIHRDLRMLRSINLILYLNDDWKESWGGHLELWDKDMTKLCKKITPSFNRAVIFRTDTNSNHGHPHPLSCPEDRFRISLASYYYRTIDNIDSIEYKSTHYKKLPGENDDHDSLREIRRRGRIKDEIL